MCDNCLAESLCRYIGQTVTVFTTSGGQSGCGFTGVLAAVSDNCIKLITDIGAAPSCPLGSNCSSWGNNNNNGFGFNFGFGCGGNNSGGGSNNWLGSVTEIPIEKIVSFTHNAI